MATKSKLLTLAFVSLGFAFTRAFGQTPGSIAVGGGTLNYVQTITTGVVTCDTPSGPAASPYTTTTYDEFSFVDGNGVTTQLNGETYSSFLSGRSQSCNPPDGLLSALLTLPDGSPSNITVNQGNGRASFISATVSTTVDPYYKLISILYAAPGDLSSTSFTDQTTNGTQSSVSSNFTSGIATTLTFGFADGSGSTNFGFSKTLGSSSQFTETVADASSLSNNAPGSGPNTVDHAQDLFLLWLNPEVIVGGTQYYLQNQYLTSQSEEMDLIEVYGSEIQPNADGATTVTADHLNKQWDQLDGVYDYPGLANACASIHGPNPNQTFVNEYNNHACTLQDQCGCTSNDFAGLVAQDPMLSSNPNAIPNSSTATSPLSVDVSGSLCASPTTQDNCRYVPVACSAASCTLQGPSEIGGNRPVNTFTQNDSTQGTLSSSITYTETQGYSVKLGIAIGPSVQSSISWQWQDSESVGSINGQANQIGYSLSSNTVGCSTDILAYEDTVFHTFVLQQAPGNGSCP